MVARNRRGSAQSRSGFLVARSTTVLDNFGHIIELHNNRPEGKDLK
jgi:hypothetical protein